MNSRLGTTPVRYIPLSKAEVVRIIEKHTRVLQKDLEKVRKGLVELEYKYSNKILK